MKHEFTKCIKAILAEEFGQAAQDIFDKSPLIQYLNFKTRSATRGSKARGSFANLYAVYVLIEDYLKSGFVESGNYSNYEGAQFTNLSSRMRQLPFGTKLQNHALNHRMNQEFKKCFPNIDYTPILRDVNTKRYWVNENLLKVDVSEQICNIASVVISIIESYIEAKTVAFESFIEKCEQLKLIAKEDTDEIESFILGLLAPNVDARLFEIVSYSILKFFYHEQVFYFGPSVQNLQADNLKLYKTGRTNANDGGIDFVMRPLGRFFQVTETLDVKKYFLDIDKIERYPISFVVKSEDSIETIHQKLKEGAEQQYSITAIVMKYMDCIEEIINIPALKERFTTAKAEGHLRDILNEIILQSKVEFNYE